MIQKKLEENQHQLTGPDFFVRSLLLTMLDILPQVMTNQFGNYLCQKIIEVCQVKNLKQFVDAVLPSIVEISMDIHGTRAIQTLVEVLGKDPTCYHNELLAIGRELE